MVYEFLKMEIDSSRYRDKIESILAEMQLSRDVITSGNIVSADENALRAEVLRRFRGYPDDELFERFPTDIEWMWTEFGGSDIAKIQYINYSYWNVLSDYSGSPIAAAKTITAVKTIYGVPNDGFIKGADDVKSGIKFPPMIFLTDETEERFIILEGHARMTAYGLVPHLFERVSVLLGYCAAEQLDKWYGEMVSP